MNIRPMVEEIQRKFHGIPPQSALMAIQDACALFATETRMFKKIVALTAGADGITYARPDDFIVYVGLFYEAGGTHPGGSFPEVTKGSKEIGRLGGKAESATSRQEPYFQQHDEVFRIGYPSSGGFTKLTDTLVTLEYYHFEDGLTLASTTKIPQQYRPGIIAAASEGFYEERDELDKAARSFKRGEYFRNLGKRQAMQRGRRDIQPQTHEF